MKRIVIFLFVCTFAHAMFSQSRDIDALQNLNTSWIGSYPVKDRAKLDQILADDFVLVNPRGIKVTKQQLLSNLENLNISAAKVDSVDVRIVAENVGLVTGYVTFTLVGEEGEEIGRTCYLDVYEKRKGKWVAVSAHVTSLRID